ncbi:MAG: phenylalanine--tRNA ligase subunit beta [Bacillota bacterium]
MKVPYNWLREYVEIPLTPEELAECLTMAGIEVGAVSTFAPLGELFVAARIEKLSPHPQAPNLQLVKVFSGAAYHDIVCGAWNIKVGDMVPLALPGAVLPGGEEIRKAEIKGVLSGGMLCSAGEMGLKITREEEEDGILILEHDSKPGEKLVDFLFINEPVLELELTPNRGDCLSMLGVAREVAALTGNSVTLPDISFQEKGRPIEELVTIELREPELCYRYTARMMEGFRIAPSPLHMQLRLLAAGVRAIYNLVDVTNYVMWETGFPMHAFDYDCIEGKKIIVRRAAPGETLVTLDGVNRVLDEEMLVIADEHRPVGMAGVMGGENTEITAATHRLFLEAACFNPVNNRGTARKLNLPSEASLRYEKGVDPEMAVFAQNRAVSLMQETAGGEICRGLLDIYPRQQHRPQLKLRSGRVKEMLGYAVEKGEMEKILQRLGMHVQEQGRFDRVEAAPHDAVLDVGVPSFRPDIKGEIDLIEEIARIKGYDQIPATLPKGVITSGRLSPQRQVLRQVKDTLTACGIQEIITFSFMHPRYFDDLELPPEDERRQAVKLQNPLTEEQEILRTTLLPNLLRLMQYNFNRQVEDQFIFELGKVYYPDGAEYGYAKRLPREPVALSLALSGKTAQNWQATSQDVDFYTLKGILETLLQSLGIKNYHWEKTRETFLHPHQAAGLILDGREIGYMGTLHVPVQEKFSLRQKVFVAELNMETLLPLADLVPRYRALPRYPAIRRDIAFIVPAGTAAASLIEEIRKAGGSLLESLHLFDVYSGNQVPAGHVSLAFALTFRHLERTLKDEDTDAIMAEIEMNMGNKYGAVLRKI